MREESQKTFPWYGYIEPYAFGVTSIGFMGMMVVSLLGLRNEWLIIVCVSLAIPALIIPAVGVYAFEKVRRVLVTRLLGERTPDVESAQDIAERDLAINHRRLFSYALRRARDVPYEEALGSFLPIRIVITIFMVLSIFLLFMIVVMQPRGVNPLASHFFLLMLFGFGALCTFCGNLALAYLWRGGVHATSHIVEGQRVITARRKVLAGTNLSGAVSLDVPASHKGELTMSRAGELSEYAEATRHDEDVTLGLGEGRQEEEREEREEEVEAPGSW